MGIGNLELGFEIGALVLRIGIGNWDWGLGIGVGDWGLGLRIEIGDWGMGIWDWVWG